MLKQTRRYRSALHVHLAELVREQEMVVRRAGELQTALLTLTDAQQALSKALLIIEKAEDLGR